jgi:hypothetical protein
MIEVRLLGEHDFIKVQYIVLVVASLLYHLLPLAEHFYFCLLLSLRPDLGYFDLFPRDVVLPVQSPENSDRHDRCLELGVEQDDSFRQREPRLLLVHRLGRQISELLARRDELVVSPLAMQVAERLLALVYLLIASVPLVVQLLQPSR